MLKKFESSLVIRNYIFWIGLSVLLMMVDRFGWLVIAKGGIETVLVPTEKLIYDSSRIIRAPVEMIRFWRKGEVLIADLERQVIELTVDAVKVEELERENEAMRRLLGAPLPKEWRFIPAAIIGRGDDLAIDVGIRQGVEEGEVVVLENMLIGRVGKVSQRQSQLVLLSNPSYKLSVYIPRTGAEGLLQGQFGSQILLTQVLQEEDIKEGDLLVTSGAVGGPRGLVVGRISQVISRQTDIYQEAMVEPLVKVRDLDRVFIVKGDGG